MQYILALGLTSLVLFILSIFAYGRNPKNKVNWTFSLYSLAIAVWSGCEAYSIAAPTQELGLLFWRLNHAAVIFIPVFFIHFVTNLLGQEKENRKVLLLSYLIGIIFLILDGGPLLIKTVVPKFSFKHMVVPGSFYLLFFILWMSGITFGLFKLFAAYIKSSGARRNQLKYLCWTSLIGYLGGPLNFLPAFNIEIYPLMPFATYGVPIYGLVIAYAIMKYRLLEVNVVLTRTGVFVIVYTLVLGVPFWFGIRTGQWFYSTIIMAILATAGPFLYIFLQRRAEKALLKEDLRKYNTLENFSRALGIIKELELDRLTRLIIYRLVKTMGISYGAIYLLDEEEDKFIFKASRSFKGVNPAVLELHPDDDFIKFIKFWRKGFMYEDLPKIMEQKANNKNSRNGHCDADLSKVTIQMERLNARLAIPHFLKDELIGFLVLGEKISLRPYSEADIEVLTTLSRSVGLAITNAISMIKLRNREREFADAARIIEIGNYASGTEHQLGNVLNSIIWACHGLKSDKTIVNALQYDPEANSAFGKRVDAIITDAKDGGTIVKEIRDYSQQGASQQYTLTNLKEVLDKTLRILYIHVNKFQNIDIPIDIATDVPDIMGSPVGLQQVFINIFNNGYDSIQEMKEYIKIHPELGITEYKGRIEVRIRRVKGKVEIHIIDNGKGIQEEVARKLFGPHFTTKGSNEKRKEMNLNGGTGIGLYIMRRIIFDHEGTIALFRSEPLKGADFIIQLPVSKQ